MEQTAVEVCGLDLAEAGALEALPCAALIERGGLVLARNEMAKRMMMNSAAGGETATEIGRVLVGADFWLRDGERTRFDCVVARRHGPALPVHVAAKPAMYEGQPCKLVLVMEHEASAEQTRADGLLVEDVLDAMPEATAITNGDAVVHVNQEFTKLFGYSLGECVGREIAELVVPEGRHHERELMMHMLRKTGRGEMETIRMTRWGEELDVCVRVVEVRLGGEAFGVLATYRDIRKQKQERARLTYSARHDGLTGLPNRAQFLERVEMMLERLRRRPDRRFAVIFLDLDGFKQVNDTMGHAAGDELLVQVADRLTGCLRPQDAVARFGGDEFALLMDESGGAAKVESVALRIQRELGREVELGKQGRAQVSASMGVVLARPGHESAEAILVDADHAMYEAKAKGKARHVLFGLMEAAG